LIDRTFVDVRRGLTSYGARAMGGGSCYDPTPENQPGVRCLLEQVLRGVRFVRADGADRWSPGVDAHGDSPLRGSVDPVSTDSASNDLALTGWVTGASDSGVPTVDSLDLYLGRAASAQSWLATAQLGLLRADAPVDEDAPGPSTAGFRVLLPLNRIPPGTNLVSLVARSAGHGTWQTAVQVVVPGVGPIPTLVPKLPPLPLPIPVEPIPIRSPMQVQAPAPDADVPRSFTVQVLAPGADRIDVFLDPGRDRGGRLAGSASSSSSVPTRSGTFQVPVKASSGPQSVYVHAHYATGPESIVTVPLTVD
jgi:hypothetical protein